MKDLDQWGQTDNNGQTFVIRPMSDYRFGGSSRVINVNDSSCLGMCGTALPNDTSDDMWNLSSALVNNKLSARLQIKKFVPGSESGWGWADAGFDIFPNGILVNGQDWAQSSAPAGLNSASYLSLQMAYTAGKKFTIELNGPNVFDNQAANDAPPRKQFTGTGAVTTYNIKATDIKKAAWVTESKYKNWDVANVNQISIKRIIESGTAGAPFPTTEPPETQLEIVCISGDSAGCGATGLVPSTLKMSLPTGIVNDGASLDLPHMADTFTLTLYNPSPNDTLRLGGAPSFVGNASDHYGFDNLVWPTSLAPGKSISIHITHKDAGIALKNATLTIPTTSKTYTLNLSAGIRHLNARAAEGKGNLSNDIDDDDTLYVPFDQPPLEAWINDPILIIDSLDLRSQGNILALRPLVQSAVWQGNTLRIITQNGPFLEIYNSEILFRGSPKSLTGTFSAGLIAGFIAPMIDDGIWSSGDIYNFRGLGGTKRIVLHNNGDFPLKWTRKPILNGPDSSHYTLTSPVWDSILAPHDSVVYQIYTAPGSQIYRSTLTFFSDAGDIIYNFHSNEPPPKTWKIDVRNLDSWGVFANENHYQVVEPTNDYYLGGSSRVTDQSGSCVGFCGTAIPNDPNDDTWYLGNLFWDDVNGKSLKSKLQITAFIPSTAQGWGWSMAGWDLIPYTQKNLVDPWTKIAGRIGILSTSKFKLNMNYSAGRKLRIEFHGQGVYDQSSATDAVPLKEIYGTGAFSTFTFNASDVKKASWVTDPAHKNWNLADVQFIRLCRMIYAGTNGAPFPLSEPATTDLQFQSLEMLSDQTTPIEQIGQSNWQIDGLQWQGSAEQVQLFNLSGALIQSWQPLPHQNSLDLSELPAGTYIAVLEQQGQRSAKQIHNRGY